MSHIQISRQHKVRWSDFQGELTFRICFFPAGWYHGGTRMQYLNLKYFWNCNWKNVQQVKYKVHSKQSVPRFIYLSQKWLERAKCGEGTATDFIYKHCFPSSPSLNFHPWMAFFTGSRKWQFNRATSELCGGQGNTVQLTFMMACGHMLSHNRISCNTCSSQTACGCLQGNDIYVGVLKHSILHHPFHIPEDSCSSLSLLRVLSWTSYYKGRACDPTPKTDVSRLVESCKSRSHHIVLHGRKLLPFISHWASTSETTCFFCFVLVSTVVEQTKNRLLYSHCCVIGLRVPSLLLSCNHNSL